MYKKTTCFFYCLYLNLFFCAPYFHRNLPYENKAPSDPGSSCLIRLQLKNGKIIEGFIKDSIRRSNEDILIVDAYDYKKLLLSDTETKYIFKDGTKITGKLQKVDKDWIRIRFKRDGKEIQEEFKRKDLIEIEAIDGGSILTELLISKRDVQSCELLHAQNCYYSFAHWLNSGEHVLVFLCNGQQEKGRISVLTSYEMILDTNNISETHLRWLEIKQIVLTKVASHINVKKAVIHFTIALGIFYVIFKALSAIDRAFSGMGQ